MTESTQIEKVSLFYPVGLAVGTGGEAVHGREACVLVVGAVHRKEVAHLQQPIRLDAEGILGSSFF